MDSGKEKTVVVTTSREVPKSQLPQQPLLLAVSSASAVSLSSSSAAAINAAQYLKQDSSSDILRQSFALKPNMPSSSNTGSSAAPRPIAPAPPGVLKSTTLPTFGVTNATNLTNVASIIRAPAAAGSPTSVVGYSGIVGVATSNPRTVMMTPNTTGAQSLTAPGAILRYPLAQIPTARLPTAALAGSSTDPGGRFQVTIVPSRGSPTSAVAGVPGIVQLHARPPSVTLSQQGHYVTALASTSAKAPVVTSSISASQLIPQLGASLSQNPMLQQAQLQQIFQASKSASTTALKGATQNKTDRVVPVTTVCLVPNIVPIAKVYPQKQGLVSSLADAATSSPSSAAAATNAVISQLLAGRTGSSSATAILPLQLQEQIQRQLISSGSIAATSGSSGPAPITQSVYLPVPIPTNSAAALIASSAAGGATSSKSSTIAALKLPATANALTTVSAAMLPVSHASAISLGQLASASAAGVGAAAAAQFLPYYAGSISGSALQSFGVGSSTTTTASVTSARASGPNQATTALLVSAAAAVSSMAASVPMSVTSAQPKKALTALPITTSTVSPHHIAHGGGVYPALSHPLSSHQSIPILKVPNVPGSGTLAGMVAAASHQSVNSAVAATAPVLLPSTTPLAVSSATLQFPGQLQQQIPGVALQPQPFAAATTPLNVLPLPRPILVSTSLSSVPFTNPNVSPRPSILRKRPEVGATGASLTSVAPRVDSLTPQDRANLITAASAAAVRKGLFHTAVGGDDDLGGGAQALRTLSAAISPGRSVIPAMRETSSQSSTDSAQSDCGFEDEEMEEAKSISAFKPQNPNVTGPTDFQSALMMKPPIITQPSYQQQQQSTLQQPTVVKTQLESGVKRPHNGGFDSKILAMPTSQSASNTTSSDAEMSPRKRLRKQQLMTKNDSSSTAGLDPGTNGADHPTSTGGLAPAMLSPLAGSGILGRNFQIGGNASPADGGSRVSRQLSFQPSPNAPTSSIPARSDATKNGLKDPPRTCVGWSGGIAPPNVAALMAASTKGDESSLSSVGDEDEDEEDGDGGDEGEYDPPHGQSRPALRKKNMSLLKTYHYDWSARLNHFQSWADVKVKEEKKSSVADMANQRNMNKRCNGWRLYQVASQLEEVMEDVMEKHSKLVELQKSIKDSAIAAAAAATASSSSILSMKPTNKKSKAGAGGNSSLADDLRTVNELFEGNLQRCKLVKDQTDEAKDALVKVIEHQPKVMDIVQKHLKKRTIKHQPLG